mmetsp:Transcript_44596/g.87354  ORF Transcript_44596/g.87354 Transcript_44596/m.87354 type:complete len:299 (+) Transcript_44596:224-1120(+)
MTVLRDKGLDCGEIPVVELLEQACSALEDVRPTNVDLHLPFDLPVTVVSVETEPAESMETAEGVDEERDRPNLSGSSSIVATATPLLQQQQVTEEQQQDHGGLPSFSSATSSSALLALAPEVAMRRSGSGGTGTRLASAFRGGAGVVINLGELKESSASDNDSTQDSLETADTPSALLSRPAANPKLQPSANFRRQLSSEAGADSHPAGGPSVVVATAKQLHLAEQRNQLRTDVREKLRAAMAKAETEEDEAEQRRRASSDRRAQLLEVMQAKKEEFEKQKAELLARRQTILSSTNGQ